MTPEAVALLCVLSFSVGLAAGAMLVAKFAINRMEKIRDTLDSMPWCDVCSGYVGRKAACYFEACPRR